MITTPASQPSPLVTIDTVLVSDCYQVTFRCPCGTRALSESCDIAANEVYGCASVRAALTKGVIRVVDPSATQRIAKRFVGEVVELSRCCELGQEGERAVVASLNTPYMSLTFPDREPHLRVVHTGADYKYLRTYEGEEW